MDIDNSRETGERNIRRFVLVYIRLTAMGRGEKNRMVVYSWSTDLSVALRRGNTVYGRVYPFPKRI